MDEVFKIFPLIQSLTTTRDALITATLDVVKEFADDGVIYLELRSTPKSTTEMTKQEYVEALIEGSGLIVGVELSGDPSVDGRKFIPALQKARDAGFKTDDKGLMDCDLSREFHEASKAFDLTLDDLNDISKNALEMSFLDKSDTVFMKLHGLLKPR
ncbi:unnamed protein product [Nippostrongylus brasiliensis]|uniref:Adenosine deaminase-like protein (inferred by orthology to a C. elegans protein) n=1 Tax=Nippostrongylus brasiliensis TaxID=27835 RepID=A0A0N4XXZ7_NIPBR|nr:unnamed protein product [Nippostrongylus brasiliensis]